MSYKHAKCKVLIKSFPNLHIFFFEIFCIFEIIYINEAHGASDKHKIRIEEKHILITLTLICTCIHYVSIILACTFHFMFLVKFNMHVSPLCSVIRCNWYTILISNNSLIYNNWVLLLTIIVENFIYIGKKVLYQEKCAVKH